MKEGKLKTYINPVFERDFPDPFVLKFRNQYWAYCTGFRNDGCFGILHSRDLVNWREVGSALNPPPFDVPCYWAPEVFYDNGLFYLYYSVGNEALMEIRVAVSDNPAGGFVDSGHKLTNEEFAIDPHIFVDTNGERYLFYATDFLEHTHIGTGTVVDKMIDEFTLEGDPRPVTRARYDWQVYDPERKEKGGVRWHTVEGPFVLKHKGVYYEMFSGGNWQQPTYGVSFATSRNVIQNEEWEQNSDGVNVLPILRTLPGKVVGPGHNSVVRSTDNRELICVYHLWAKDLSGRIMAIDRMDFACERIFINGATTTPQPLPYAATFEDFFDDGLSERWERLSGDWIAKDNSAVQTSSEENAEARYKTNSTSFLLEVSLSSSDETQGSYGVALGSIDEHNLRFEIEPSKNHAVISYKENSAWREEEFSLPENFNPRAFHLLRIEVDNLYVSVVFGNELVRWEKTLEKKSDSVSLITQNTVAAFSGFALTEGWENLFDDNEINLSDLGWQSDSIWRVEDKELVCKIEENRFALINKNIEFDSYEFTVNARVKSEQGNYGFYPALLHDNYGILVTVERDDSHWVLIVQSETHSEIFPLPENFDATIHQQLRFRKTGGHLYISHEAFEICEIEVPYKPTHIGLYSLKGAAAFDMVRVTRLN